ncbi:hypothetical protein [Buchananella hordeovulneris]|uniref:hypothetical protein n=1 Tax=Buchananella hordeovulneris TaxID=52770 RepID=UPI0026DAF243|nr:hypothetical protein [Buchananella hordeovulneris]MDO5080772.1 hypothetical protein [Buchananella hordeovulneris]
MDGAAPPVTYFDQDPLVATASKLPHGYVTEVVALAPCELDGHPCVVTLNLAGQLRVRDAATGVDVRSPLGGGLHDSTYWAQDYDWHLHVVDIDGVPHALASAIFGDVECWNLDTGEQRGREPGYVQVPTGVWMQDFDVWQTPDGEWRVAFVTEQDELHVIDPVTGRAVRPAWQSQVKGLEWVADVPGTAGARLAGMSWRGELAIWELQAGQTSERVVPGAPADEVLAYVDAAGAAGLAVCHEFTAGTLARWNLDTGQPQASWRSSTQFTLLADATYGPVACTVHDGVFEVRRLADGAVVVSAAAPDAAGVWLVVPCTNQAGQPRWACFWDVEIRFLDPAAGQWSAPVAISYPVRGKTENKVHGACAVPGGRLALGLINGWASVEVR